MDSIFITSREMESDQQVGFHDWRRQLFYFPDQLQKLCPFLLKEVDGDVVHFNVIRDFAIGFLGFPGEEVFGLCEGAGAGFVFIVTHDILLGGFGLLNNDSGGFIFRFFVSG